MAILRHFQRAITAVLPHPGNTRYAIPPKTDKRREQAQEAADEAVARIPTATQYQKDMIETFVYNQAFIGNWSKIKYLIVPRLDITNGLIDLTGNLPAATLGGAGATHLPNNGINVTSTSYIDTPASPLTAAKSPTDRSYWALCHITGYDDSALAVNDNAWVWAQREADFSNSALVWNQNTIPDRFLRFTANGTFNNAQFSYGPDLLLGKTMGVRGLNDTSQDSEMIVDGVSEIQANGGAIGAGSLGVTFTLGGRNANGVRDQFAINATYSAWGLAESSLNYAAFEEDMDGLMKALERDSLPFGNVLMEGDSLLDPVPQPPYTTGYVPIQAYITTLDNYTNEANSGDLLVVIKNQIVAELDTNGNPNGYNALVLTGGTNDINPANDTSEFNMQSHIDAIFAACVTAGIWDVFYFQMTPLRYSSFDPGALPQTPPPGDLPQANIDREININAYIQQKIDAHNLASPYDDDYAFTDSGIYAEMESGGSGFNDALARRNIDPSQPPDAQVVIPDETKPAFTIFGVHYTHTGAEYRANKFDAVINAARFTKR